MIKQTTTGLGINGMGKDTVVQRDDRSRVGVRKRALVSCGALAALSCGFSFWVKAAEVPSMPVLEGSAAYRVNCANCHGENLSGGYGPSLRDIAFRTKWTSLGPAALREFLSTRMPPSDPGGLPQDAYEQIATFIEQTSGMAMTPRPPKQNAALPLPGLAELADGKPFRIRPPQSNQ
jgi:mono/diheme cytochrome c family protein